MRIRRVPERDLTLGPQDHRAIQFGLSGQVVDHYIHQGTATTTTNFSSFVKVGDPIDLAYRPDHPEDVFLPCGVTNEQWIVLDWRSSSSSPPSSPSHRQWGSCDWARPRRR
jgi:hypothetical protein